jgi:hypothetical protein
MATGQCGLPVNIIARGVESIFNHLFLAAFFHFHSMKVPNTVATGSETFIAARASVYV